ncbi:MAG: ABC transporter permease [Rhodospirillaceae bacterium]|nr:MAG: ABC transporter permease [Rhodospirillaceae bacterium]
MAAAERRAVGNVAHLGFFRRNGAALSVYLLGAVGLWILLLIVLPQLYMVEFSFRPRLPPSEMGGPKDAYTLANYSYLIFGRPGDPEGYNKLHLGIFLRTIVASIFVTMLNFAICYPIAFFMAKVAKGGQMRLMVLALIVPFWVNEILRAFAFRILFSSSGVFNTLLLASGLVDAPVDFLRSDIALYAGLSYAYLLLMIFPLYNAIEAMDSNQIEAARDLGAPWWHIHLFVVMPYAKPGIAAGCTMVFMLTAGALAAPQVLGGPSSLWFTQVVYNWFYQAFNWNLGAAYAFALLIACIIFVMVVLRLFKVSLGEIAR